MAASHTHRHPIQSLKTGVLAQILPLVTGYGLNILATPYVVTQLGLHQFGIWSITGAIAQYAGLLDLGASRAVGRNVALFHSRGDVKNERAVLGVCLTAVAILGALLCGLATLVPKLMDRVLGTGDPALARFLLLSAIAMVIIGLTARMVAAASMGRGRQFAAGAGLSLLTLMQVSGGVIALALQPTLRSFASGSVIGTAGGLLTIIVIVLIDERRVSIGWPARGLAREVLTYGASAQMAAFGDMILLQSGKLIAGVMLGPTAAGVYELATRAAMGAQAFAAASAGALTPHLTRYFSQGGMNGILEHYEHLTRRNAVVSLFIPFLMTATAVTAIPLWLDSSKGQVEIVLLALLPGIAVNASTGVCTSTLAAIGRPHINAQVTVAAGVAQALIAIALGNAFGFWGIALAFAFGVPIGKIAGVVYMQARAKIPMRLYLRGVRGPYFVAIVATCVAFPVGLIARPSDRLSALWPFVASTALFCAAYLLLSTRRNYLPRIIRRRRSDVPEPGPD